MKMTSKMRMTSKIRQIKKWRQPQRCLILIRWGGVSIFQKCLKFKNVPKVGGGGGNPNCDIVSLEHLVTALKQIEQPWNILWKPEASLKHLWNNLETPYKLTWNSFATYQKITRNPDDTPLKLAWNSIDTYYFKHPENTLETALKLSWIILEILLTHPWNFLDFKNPLIILETALKHP